jgi:phosphohistidine phosphatase
MSGVRVCLVHHADAVGPDVDPLRPLSELGRTQADRLAARAHERGISPDVIWHSGKVRSRQTAEAFLRVCNPFADFRMVRGLRPDDPLDWMRDELAAETRNVLLVGHMPHIAALSHVLVPSSESFPLHGLVAFERKGTGGWVELLRISIDSN